MAWSGTFQKNIIYHFSDNFFLQLLLQHNWISQKNSIFANLQFSADSKSRAQELSNDVSFIIFGHQTWDLEGGGGQRILVFKYHSRDRVNNQDSDHLNVVDIEIYVLIHIKDQFKN